MSKSDPFSAIFMEDLDEDVRLKIEAAYCPLVPEPESDSEDPEESMRLTDDPLKNPCLDYIRYIVFSVPGSKFVIGNKTYTDYDSVRDSFIQGNIPEKDLKASLIQALSSLIQPVREHFQKDPDARQLLQTILAFKKEDEGSAKFRRLEFNQTPNPWVIFGPLASARFDLGTLLTLLKQLHYPPPESEVILYLPDWSSFTLNCIQGDKKVINSTYTLLIEGIFALAPALRNRIKVTLQSEAILTNPNDYWISVINVGRKFNLCRVRAVDEANPQTSQVISSLMHVGDVLGSGAAHIVSIPSQENLNLLAIDYCKLINRKEINIPQIHSINPVNGQLKEVIQAGFDDPDMYIYPFLDIVADTNRKLKKAFCAPGNIEWNPLLLLAEEITFSGGGKLSVKRAPENGGDKVYTDIQSVQQDFKEGQLHPGDLKPPLTKSVEAYLAVIRELIKKDVPKKALNDIKNYIKNSTDKKKK
jgi:tyrosyl-tRNA synthetase